MDPPIPPKHKSRFRKHLLLVVPLLLCAVGGIYSLCRSIDSVELNSTDGSEGYRIKLLPTRNTKRDTVEMNLRVIIRSFSIDGNFAHFQLTDFRNFRIGDGFTDSRNSRIDSEFTVAKPGDLFHLTEYHGGTVFMVKQITADSIILGYIHTFSGYNGFGGQLVMEDQGEIILKPFVTL